MKLMLAIACSAVLAAVIVRAQSPSSPPAYKVVFDLTTDDPQDQTAVLRWLREVAAANPQSEMEVVMYGRGLALVVPGAPDAPRGHARRALLALVAPSALIYGVTLRRVGIRDIVLPGVVRTVFLKEVEADRTGRADLVRARHEIAAGRTLSLQEMRDRVLPRRPPSRRLQPAAPRRRGG